jgi:hypothetical protein
MNAQLTNRDYQQMDLTKRHRQFVRTFYGRNHLPYDRTVIAFRPKGQTSLALTERFREIGTTEMIRLCYQPAAYERPERMPLLAYRRRWLSNKVEEYGSNAPIFCLNGMLSPSTEAFGGRISTTFDPLLGELLLQMHYACLRHRFARRRLQSWVVLPKVYLGFYPDRRPVFEDSPLLREKAAQRLGVPLAQLGKNGSVLLDEMLRNLWRELWIEPDHQQNNTGFALIDHRLCTASPKVVSVWEDFFGLRGAVLPNPCRGRRIAEDQPIDVEELHSRLPVYFRQLVASSELLQAALNPGHGLRVGNATRIQMVKATTDSA